MSCAARLLLSPGLDQPHRTNAPRRYEDSFPADAARVRRRVAASAVLALGLAAQLRVAAADLESELAADPITVPDRPVGFPLMPN